MDIEYFGDIHAGKKGVKILQISNPEQVIQLFERKNLQEQLRNQWTALSFLIESKYGFDSSCFDNY